MESLEMRDWPRKPLYTSEAVEEHSPSLSKRKSHHSLLPWVPEIGGILASLVSVGAVIALLRAYSGQPVPEWSGVTFNFVIGALAQISHAFMIGPLGAAMGQLKWCWFWNESRPRRLADSQTYDKASRGVVGAVSMFFSTRLRPATSIGALLIIATLGIDPFLQGIPTYPIRMVPANGNATISIAKNYYNVLPSFAGADSEETWYVLGSTAKGAFYSGLFNTTSNNTIVPSCPTGNCTWEPYSSLGVCSACTDVTSSLSQQLNPEGYDGESVIWTMLNGLTADSGLYQMLANASYDTIEYGNLQDYVLADLSSMYWNSQAMDNPEEPTAFECILYFCVHTYQADVFRGKFHETLLSSFPNASTPTRDAQGAIRPASSTTALPPVHPSATTISYIDSSSDMITISPPGNSAKFKFDTATLTLMRIWLQAVFSAELDSNANPGTNAGDVSQVLFDSMKIGRLPDLFGDVASSLTAHIRGGTGETANGTTQSVIVIVEPRWAWLIFPLSVLAAGLAFLVVTIVLSANKRMPTWKSSTLPGMVYSMDVATSTAIAARGPILQDMEKEAKRHVVAMSRDEDPWTLRRTRYEDINKALREEMMGRM